MPLRGKIVVIKRSGGDGTEFPLTASCLFGRKPDCDIRIQLPQVSKEHCRIDLNENKEVILTNLSSVNPTRVNGEVLHQAERLKHGDVITVIDRSFRFEYPPAATPKKRSSRGGKLDTLKVLQDQQVGDKAQKRVSEVSTDPLKDGTNNNNIQQSLEKTVLESQEGGSSRQSKSSPFNDLYQMIKQSLDVKTPRKSSISLLQTPCSKFCTPKPVSVRKSEVKPATVGIGAHKKDDANVEGGGTPQSAKKKKTSSLVLPTEPAGARDQAASPQRRSSGTAEKSTVSEVIEQITQTPKSPVRRRSKETTPTKPSGTKEQAKQLQRASPRNSAKGREASKKRKSGELGPDLAAQQLKRKRVSFGGQLSPELFDKRLPPDSPLRKGAAPRRSLSLLRPKQSLLRRASVIGMLKESPGRTKKSSAAKTASPKTPTPEKKGRKSKSSPAMKSPKSASSSPKAATPAAKSPKSASASPKAATPAKRSPKAATPATKSASSSPKAATPAAKSPKSTSASPKAATPAKRSPKAATPATKSASSPKAATPAAKSPKSASSSPKAATPAAKSPKSASSSPKAATPRSLSPAGRTPARDQRVPTPAVQGRFSVSRIATPSPVAETNAFTEQLPSVAVTPMLRLKRKSMKSTSKKTPSISKSAIKVIQRRSGISRASLKVSNCWADIVKFGKPKAQLGAQSHVKITQKTVKKTAPKPLQKTPARKLKGHVSTGHADSPATIVVGRAHKRTVNHPTGAAPRVITNIALFRKNMRMDEDLSGISEMFKTPVSKKRSVSSANGDVATPAGPAASVIEPSLLNTPEEPGEMVVSPLSVASVIKGRRYNSEAVQRLLNGDEESSFTSDASALQIESEAAAVKTPGQKSEVPDCLTGVKRIMKTPRQKAEPIDDMREKLLKTPEQQECLTGVKRIMKTPRQKAEPVDDIRGRLLRTPRQKPEQEECLSAVKRVFKTPQHDDKLQSLKTPEAPQVADVLETPSTMKVSQDLSEAMETPITKISGERLTEIRRMVKTPREKGAPVEDMVGVKRIMRTPKVKGQPVEDNFGIKRLMRSPRLRGNSPVEDFQGLKELMEEPLPEPVEQQETNQDDPEPVQCGADVVQELEFTPQSDESSDAVNVSKLDVTKAIEAVDEHVDLQSVPDVPGPSDVEEIVPEAAAEENLLRQQRNFDKVDEDLQAQEETTAGKSAEVEATVPEPGQEKTIQGTSPAAPVRGRRGRKVEAAAPPAVPQMKRGRRAKGAEVVVEETPEAEVAVKPKRGKRARKVPDEEEVVPAAESEESRPAGAQLAADDDDDNAAPEKLAAKPKRGRKAKQPEGAEPEQQGDSPPEVTEESNPDVGGKSQSESELNKPADADESQSSAAGQRKSVRGRRGKQMEAEEKQEVAEEPIRGRRGRKVEAAAPPAVPQMKRGRLAKCADVEVVVEETPEAEVAVKPKRGRRARKVPDEEEVVPAAESEESRPAGAQLAADDDDNAAPEKLAAKPKRGRKAKQPEGAEPEQQDDSPPELNEEATRNTDVSEKLEESQADEAQRKSVRGRRGKQMEAEEKQEVAEEPVRGRRGRKIEAAAPPAVPQLKRGRIAKTQENSSHQAADETLPESEKSEPQTEVQPVEMVICEEAVVKPAAAKPRRGARAKPEAPSVSIQAQEEKPKRGRRGRQAAEEQEVASQNQTTAEESGNGEPDAAVLKPSKTRGAKPAQGVPLPVVPAKRARRAAAAPPLEETGSAKVNSSEDWSAGKEAKTSKTVKWNAELKVIKIPKTAVRAGRGGRSKVADKFDSGSQDVPEAEQAEEDLSGKAVDAPPGKRTRRGTKTADVSADKEEPPETLPKVRRGRPARK